MRSDMELWRPRTRGARPAPGTSEGLSTATRTPTYLATARSTWGSCSHLFRASTLLVFRWGLASRKTASDHRTPEIQTHRRLPQLSDVPVHTQAAQGQPSKTEGVHSCTSRMAAHVCSGRRAEAACAACPTAHLEPQGPTGTDGTTSWRRLGWKSQQLPRVHSQGLSDFTAENLL